jgi:hypothetical protein
VWARHFETIEQLRQALLTFRDVYNTIWLIKRHGYLTPAAFRWNKLRTAQQGGITSGAVCRRLPTGNQRECFVAIPQVRAWYPFDQGSPGSGAVCGPTDLAESRRWVIIICLDRQEWLGMGEVPLKADRRSVVSWKSR